MGRVKTVNGCRKPVGTQVPEPVLAAIEIARGDKDRSSWIRDLICDELDRQGISTAPLDSLPPRIPVVKTARPRTRANGRRPPKDLPPPENPAGPPPRSPARRPGQAVFQDPGAEAVVTDAPPAPASQRTKCRHPIFRVFGSRDPSARGVDGCCPICGHAVEPGGYWEPECDAGTCEHS